MIGEDVELDPILVAIAESIRTDTDLAVAVEGDVVAVGDSPDCAFLLVESGTIKMGFHRYCHPMALTRILIVVLAARKNHEMVFTSCFLSDMDGALTYEAEIGFSHLQLQYLRNMLGIKTAITTIHEA